MLEFDFIYVGKRSHQSPLARHLSVVAVNVPPPPPFSPAASDSAQCLQPSGTCDEAGVDLGDSEHYERERPSPECFIPSDSLVHFISLPSYDSICKNGDATLPPDATFCFPPPTLLNDLLVDERALPLETGLTSAMPLDSLPPSYAEPTVQPNSSLVSSPLSDSTPESDHVGHSAS
ncbi:unnamed protein product [Protopolystoma xenopodis]|uniref:Uncharacterized protein n=1 Tax=Protopolystoma xenopodis TaxID=117903 RepID=A0A3S5ARL5_9PLAT|nr:unnamed protein product [Protopolystoma xenopodis]